MIMLILLVFYLLIYKIISYGDGPFDFLGGGGEEGLPFGLGFFLYTDFCPPARLETVSFSTRDIFLDKLKTFFW